MQPPLFTEGAAFRSSVPVILFGIPGGFTDGDEVVVAELLDGLGVFGHLLFADVTLCDDIVAPARADGDVLLGALDETEQHFAGTDAVENGGDAAARQVVGRGTRARSGWCRCGETGHSIQNSCESRYPKRCIC